MSEVDGTTPQRPETIYLVSTSGHANFGDEFIAAAWLRYLAQQRPDAEVILDCGSPGVATHLFDGLHPRLKTTDILWRVVWETADMSPDEAVAHVDRLVTDLGTPRWDYGLLAARRATTIHFLGGGHITSRWPHHERLLRAGLRLRDLSGASLFATGLGLVPASDANAVRTWLGGFDHASVRDDTSAELTGLRNAADDAFLGLPQLPAFAASQRDVGGDGDIWLCLQRELADEDTFEAILATTRRLLTSDEYAGRAVHYVESIPGGDRIAFDRLSDLIPEENFVPFVRFWDEPFPARPGQLWLTTRFHVHLLAAASGAAGVAFEIDDDYYRTKHESLTAAGTGWTRVPVGGSGDVVPEWNSEFRLGAGRMHRSKVEEADSLYPRQARPAPVREQPAPEVRQSSGWLRRRR